MSEDVQSFDDTKTRVQSRQKELLYIEEGGIAQKQASVTSFK